MSNSPVPGAAADEPLDGHKLAAARLWATNRYPYLASAVFAASVHPGPGLDRLMIDRWWRVHADPATVASATVEQLGGELLHLVSHLLRDHAGRADGQHLGDVAELHHWVDAADAEIVDDFPSDLERVSPLVTPETLACTAGRFAEEYYRQGALREGETNDCGSGAHGNAAAWEPPPPSDRDDQGVTEDQQQLIRRNVAAEIARSEAAVSESLRRWAAEQLAATVDWRAELAASIRRAVSATAGAVDYTYRRPSRRSGAAGPVVLPSLMRPTVEVAVVCDSSGSVGDDLLGVALAEVDGLLRAVGTRNVSVLAVDDAVRTVSRVARGRDVVLLGGGGTDMALGIDAAMALRPEPSVVVVLTDGYTPWPDTPPRASVVAGLLEDSSADGAGLRRPEPPPWVRAVPIPGP
ncbi:MAG: VWA-like domain-containing protein [Actinomycetota bacterium]